MRNSIARVGLLLMFLWLAPLAHAQSKAVPESTTSEAGRGATGTTSGQDSITGTSGAGLSGPSVDGALEAHPSPHPTQGQAPVDARVRSTTVAPAKAETSGSRDYKCLCADPVTNERRCEASCCAEQNHSVCTEP